MSQRSTALTRYIREAGMNVSRNVQELFGTTEAAVVTQLDPTPNREGATSKVGRSAGSRRAAPSDRLSPRGRRGRD